MKAKKIQKEFIDSGFGFPVKLLNVPMVKVRGAWTPSINYNRLAEAVLTALCNKPARLTGNEVQFIRLHFGMTLQEFAKRFAVSHVAVMKWEKSGNHPTAMSWALEKDLRLFGLLQNEAKPNALTKLYISLNEVREDKRQMVELNAEKLAA